MNQFSLELVAKHYPQHSVPLYRSTPWCVLIECSDHESQEHARGLLERLLETALDRGCAGDAVVAQSLTQAQRLWRIRESIPLALAHRLQALRSNTMVRCSIRVSMASSMVLTE